jgi:uncharacterized alpha-E superfamily protein
MLSRAAENIYWMARYLERAENTARLVAVHAETRLDHPDPPELAWETLLSITGTLEDFDSRGLRRIEEDAVEFLLSDPQNPSSLLSICARARENNRTLIEILPRESWEEVNELHQLTAVPGAAKLQQRGEHLREVIGRAQAMAGLFLGALNDDDGYAILRLGRAIERADFATRVLLRHFNVVENGAEDHQALRGADWVGVLRSLTAFQMYRRSVQGPVTGQRVVRFLTCSTVFPRSIAYCAAEAERALVRLPNSEALTAAAAHLSTSLQARIDSAVTENRKSGAHLTSVQAELHSLHDMAVATYFVPHEAAPARTDRSQRQGRGA